MKNICYQMNRKVWLVMLFALCMAIPALAQKIAVQGTVVDPSGEPVIGANVIPKGAANGVVTDMDGNFRITTEKNATLVVSYVGYNKKDVAVNGQTNIKVVLEENSVMLNEVVAIGYGVVKKSDATGSVSMVKPDEVQAGLATSAQDLLVGKSPGVVVTSSGGQPEGGATIRIRGGSSLNASNDPLIVIDGVPMDNKGTMGMSNGFGMISPENIESMTILKDASATAIYGSRASNGVIIITSKKGSAGGPKFNFSANMYVNTPRNYTDNMTADEFRSMISNRYGTSSSQYAALGNANTNWQKEILRTTISSDYSLSVGGTAGFLPYRVAATYTNSNGIVKTTSMNRATLGVNLAPKFFDGLLSINANVKGFFVANRGYNGDALGAAVSMDPTQPVYQENKFNNYFTYTSAGNINTLATLNPVSLIQDYKDQSQVFQSIGNLQIDLAMPFLRDLHANLNVGYDISNSNKNIYNAMNSPTVWKNNWKDGTGTDYKEYQYKRNLLLDFYLNYKKDIAAIKSALDVTLGYSWQRFEMDGWNETLGFTPNYVGSTENINKLWDKRYFYANHNQLVSFFGRLNYTLRDKYLLTVTVRDDGTSRFSKDNRWGTFPSVALGWKIINESFMEGATGVMNELKLRAGWGITGQQDLNDDYFPYLATYKYGTNMYRYPNVISGTGNDYVTTIKANGYSNSIKWEETTTWNAGIDFGFLNNRINGSVDFYKRETKDLLCFITVPAGSNLTNAMNTNIGNLENVGVEFVLNTKPVVTRNFTWSSDVNVAWNKNKITKLIGGEDDKSFIITTGRISAGTGTDIQAHSVGYPAFSYYTYEQVYDESGEPMEGVFVDRNGDGVIDTADKYLNHSRDPKVTISWSNGFNFKNWDLGFVLRANIGNYVYNDMQAGNTALSSEDNAWLSNLLNYGHMFNVRTVQSVSSDYFVQNASFVRCDNITLGYTWKSLLKGSLRLRLYAAVQNPFVITKYKGLDPEVFSGIDNNVYPRPTTYSLGVVASF